MASHGEEVSPPPDLDEADEILPGAQAGQDQLWPEVDDAAKTPESSALSCRVQALEEELRNCQEELRSIQRQLSLSQRLHRSAEATNQELRTQAKKLSKEIYEFNKREKVDQEVQTDEYSSWSDSYYYHSSYENYTHTDAHEVKASNGSDATMDGSQAGAKPQEDPGESKSLCDGEGQEANYSQEESGTSLAESLRATAEAALSQTGFTYDENTGMYYDHSTGFYYDSESQLYYDPSTGIYYYCDVENGRYLFHSKVDFQSCVNQDPQPSTEKKKKKKREASSQQEDDKVLNLTESMVGLRISPYGYSPYKDTEQIWPPCIRVIVVRSPVLQKGSLFIITAEKSATIGREKNLGHDIRIPEVGVSKFHAEVYFDHSLQSYVLVDQGSQNGTIINGNPILQPKVICEPVMIHHGDEVKFGETVLSFHVHPGSETCDGCEPGQVRAHLRLNQKEEYSAGPVLSKAEKEKLRRKGLKQIRDKYGLQTVEYEDNKVLKNSKYKDRAGRRRKVVGSEGTFQRDDAPASVHVEINDSNKGRQMLEKMGWKKGEGLGKSGDGMKNPIHLQLHKKQAGLGAHNASSVEDIQSSTRNQKNWEKARERYAENFQESNKNDAKKATSWVKSTVQ
ncbi:angiogenic factor with G patch and FHA domains 1 isoform X2 [Phyllobates terribilis]|uniref:angiogenic factor with G patch and FHA domains 1 isoform X2 n=1 Tax=Phyllobates terribilis TaxID=111132 RepID=UPI003CCA8D3E